MTHPVTQRLLEDIVRSFSRPDVTDFVVAAGRLPSARAGGTYEPTSNSATPAETVLALLVSLGGSRYVESLGAQPVSWRTRLPDASTVVVTALEREGILQARISPQRDGANGTAAASRAAAPVPPSAALHPSSPAAKALDAEPIELAFEPKRETADPFAALEPLDRLLAQARQRHASDLHLVAGRPALLRIAGELVPSGEPIDPARLSELLLPAIPARLRPAFETDGSCDFARAHPQLGRFRVNVTRQRTGLKGSFRLIGLEVPTLAELGLPDSVAQATHHHQGLIVVTGPTGHGKTTTLAALIDVLNRETAHHIITVEDPIEYVHPRKRAMMTQREVGTHTKSFFNALKASLREDPDVIVVGELRDTETVRMALSASETGHLVLGTMNTPSAAKTIDRLIDLFPPADQAQVRTTLAGGLRLIVSQRLVRTADSARVVAAAEILPGSVALWNLIRESKTYQIPSLQQRGKSMGIVRLDDSLADLVRSHTITLEAAQVVAEDPDELAKAVRAKPGAALGGGGAGHGAASAALGAGGVAHGAAPAGASGHAAARGGAASGEKGRA